MKNLTLERPPSHIPHSTYRRSMVRNESQYEIYNPKWFLLVNFKAGEKTLQAMAETLWRVVLSIHVVKNPQLIHHMHSCAFFLFDFMIMGDILDHCLLWFSSLYWNYFWPCFKVCIKVLGIYKYSLHKGKQVWNL